MQRVTMFDPTRRSRAVLLVIVVVLGCPPLATHAADFEVTSSFPVIYSSPPSDLTLEGAVNVTATADGPVAPLESYDWLIQTGEMSWTTVFRWYETDARIARFVGADDDTVSVTFLPAPRMPLDFERHALPILHITTDPANLWDPEIGIYAWGYHDNFLRRGDEWERPATLEYFEADGSPVFSEPIGLRINGESSRAYRQKGLRFYFDDYGTSDDVVHDFFGDGPVRCERLVVRGAAYADFAIGSGMAEPLHMDLGHPGSRWSYVAVYLNGEYWGAYSLRERFDSKWVETTHEWADDDYVVVKDHEAVCGDYTRWEDFLAGLQAGDPASHAWYQWLDSQLDIISYLDWVLVNASGQTADNMHGKNLAIVKIGGDRFRFMGWDEDILFLTANRDADHFSFYAAGDVAEYVEHTPPAWYSGGPWDFTFDWNALLRRGMQSAEFKAVFRARAAELLDGPLSIRELTERLDALEAIQAPEWDHHEIRWNPPVSYAYRAGVVRAGFAYRRNKVGNLVEEFLDTWADPVELSAFTVAPAVGEATLAWHTEREESCAGWIVERSLDTPDAFAAIASYLDVPGLVGHGGPATPFDYEYVDIAMPVGLDVYYRLTHVDDAGFDHVHDWIESAGAGPEFDLRLNEFLAANDTTMADEAGEFDDWVEVYNVGEETVELGGLFLSDNLAEPTKWAFPMVVLEPGGFLLVWCDEDLDQGPLHASFKLSASGEELGIFAGFAAGNAPIDTLVFGSQTADISLGRLPDGTGGWTTFTAPTPGTTNDPQTAVAPHVSPSTTIRLSPAWPNPSPGQLTVAGLVPVGLGPARLQIYTVRGELVRELHVGRSTGQWCAWTWNGRDTAGRPAPAGVYLLRLQAGRQTNQQRVVLVR